MSTSNSTMNVESSAASATGSNPSSQSQEIDKSDSDPNVGPLWKFVDIVQKDKAGGNTLWQCKLCSEMRKCSYTRVKAHLLKEKGIGVKQCSEVTTVQIREMNKLEDEYLKRTQNKSAKKVPLPSETRSTVARSLGGICGASSNIVPAASLKRRKMDKTIAEAFDMNARDQLDCEIARMFYTGGLPFNLARNPYYLSSYSLAADGKLAGYVPPGFNRLRTTLLEQEKKHVEVLIEPIKSLWPEKGVTIVSDGWGDPQRRPLINFMVVSEGGPMFLKAVNCAGEVKDKVFISKLLMDVIDEVGHQNVVQIVTDNASNCKVAGEIIEGKYPHIYWTLCVVHTLNLGLKNICDSKNVEGNHDTYDLCHWITVVYNDAMKIKIFIMNHGMRLSMFNKFTPLKLLSIADTRFASVVVMLKRFKLIRHALESMVMGEQWSLYKDDAPTAKFVRDTIVNEDWWESVNYIVEFTAPIYDMIRICDTDKPCLHLVYEMWDSMIENVRKVIYKHEKLDLLPDNSQRKRSEFAEVVNGILQSRWLKSHRPLHCVAHSLNPRYYSQSWIAEIPGRKPPHLDDEVSSERIKCFRRLFPNVNAYKQVLYEFGQFSLKSGPFADSMTISLMETEDPKFWWVNFGSSVPLLQGLAFKLLGQPVSSSCCERNWSTYSFIHSMKRNRLTPMRAEELVFIHNNLRLLSRKSEVYSSEHSKMWDVGGDQYGSLEETGILDIADLSLDEPELEEEFLAEE